MVRAISRGAPDYQFAPEQSAQVTGIIHDFQLQENAWRSICSRLGLSYLEIWYEDLADDPLCVLGKVHDWLEFPRESVKAPVTIKLSNPTSLKAKDAYLQTIGA
jgi:LPS sulfotransferase NodH